jgi:hypothetical protein
MSWFLERRNGSPFHNHQDIGSQKVSLCLQFVGNSIKLPGRFTIIDYICSSSKGSGEHLLVANFAVKAISLSAVGIQHGLSRRGKSHRGRFVFHDFSIAGFRGKVKEPLAVFLGGPSLRKSVL